MYTRMFLVALRHTVQKRFDTLVVMLGCWIVEYRSPLNEIVHWSRWLLALSVIVYIFGSELRFLRPLTPSPIRSQTRLAMQATQL